MPDWPLLNRYSLAVWIRNYLTWRQLIWSSLASNVVNPLIFLFAFGFGLGRVVPEIGGIPYLVFVTPGMIAHGAMFAATFECTISAYARFSMQRTWDATLSSPMTLGELLLGELLWAASKALFAGVMVLLVGYLWGGVPSVAGAIAILPFVLIASLTFAACGLLATSYANGFEFFSYVFTFWVTPMLMFSGTFFEVSRLPEFLQWAAWLLPMTHLIAIIRPLTAGLSLEPLFVLLHTLYLIGLCCIAFALAYRRLQQRMFD